MEQIFSIGGNLAVVMERVPGLESENPADHIGDSCREALRKAAETAKVNVTYHITHLVLPVKAQRVWAKDPVYWGQTSMTDVDKKLARKLAARNVKTTCRSVCTSLAKLHKILSDADAFQEQVRHIEEASKLLEASISELQTFESS